MPTLSHLVRPFVCSVALAASLASGLVASGMGRHDPEPYVRVTDDAEKSIASLDVAVRSFVPDGKGPTVYLVGAVHVGDQAYYDGLQTLLDGMDVVLFEGVKPGAIATPEKTADDATRAKITKQRVRMVGIAIEQYRRKHGKLPVDVCTAIGTEHGPSVQALTAASVDGWGNVLVYEPDGERKFDLVSRGSDGKAGGEGTAADIKLSGMKALSKEELSVEEGIQTKLAKALKLEFQLSAMDYSKKHWRNSDMTVEELTKRLGGSGEGSDDGEGKQNALLGMLSGQSFGAKIVGGLLKLIEWSPTLSSATKLMMLEMLGRADELMEAQGSAMMGVGGEQFMKVLIDDRNDVVLVDLDRLIKDEPELKTIAVFYGAGHLAKMEKSLIERGYAIGGTTWHTAISLDLKTLPGGAAGSNAIREQIRKQIDAQLKK
jgi:hypothetical protein